MRKAFMSAHNPALEKSITLNNLHQYKKACEKISCIALYDAPMAAIAEKSGIDIILVGDSLGMTVQGHTSTLPVTIEHMTYHTAAVARGNKKSFIMSDMPFMTYATPTQAMENAALLMQSGAHMVKLEGGNWLVDTVKMLNERGIPVCAHLGLTPQSVNKFGGYRVQGRSDQQAEQIFNDATELAHAGADLLVLECVPQTLAKKITEEVNIITVGIGAGADTHSQVLVANDMIGITATPPKFSKNFLSSYQTIEDAFAGFAKEIKAGEFPKDEHSF
jgi:3-methyl-2-oxobutanoate hydroxymethyltransferase